MSSNTEDLAVEIGLSEKQYLAALKRIEAQTIRGAKRNEAAFKKSNKGIERSFRQADAGMSKFSGGLRGVSMQLSQVAQQGAVTGNYLQALAIQAPDLALGFGAVGIAAGAVIPILYGVAQAALGAEEQIEKIDLQAAYGSATKAIDAAREAQDRYTAAIALSGAAQAEITPQVLANLQLEAQAREALAALEIAQLERQRLAVQQGLEANRRQLDALLADVNQGLEFDPNAGFVASEVEAARLQNVRDVLNANEDLVLTIREQAAELDLVNALIAQGHGEAAELVDQLLNASLNAEGTASAVGSIDFSTAISGAEDLAARLQVSLHRAMQIMGVIGAAAQAARDAAAGPMLDPRDPNYDPTAAGMQRIRDEGYGTTSPFAPSRRPRTKARGRRRGGGGGGGMSDAQRAGQQEENRLLRERDQILRDLETSQDKYNREVADLDALLKAGHLSTEQYLQALSGLQAELRQAEFGAVIDAVDSVSSAMGQAIVFSENMGEAVGNVFRNLAAEIVSSGVREAILSVFNLGSGASGGTGGFWGALAGAVFGGGKPTGKATGGIVRRGQAYEVGENGREIYVPPQNGRILSTAQAQQALSGGSQASGQFALTYAPVIDARGVDSSALARLEAQQRQFAASLEDNVHDILRRGRHSRRNLSSLGAR